MSHMHFSLLPSTFHRRCAFGFLHNGTTIGRGVAVIDKIFGVITMNISPYQDHHIFICLVFISGLCCVFCPIVGCHPLLPPSVFLANVPQILNGFMYVFSSVAIFTFGSLFRWRRRNSDMVKTSYRIHV